MELYVQKVKEDKPDLSFSYLRWQFLSFQNNSQCCSPHVCWEKVSPEKWADFMKAKDQMRSFTFVKGNYQELDKVHILQETDRSLDIEGCCSALAKSSCVGNVDGKDLF